MKHVLAEQKVTCRWQTPRRYGMMIYPPNPDRIMPTLFSRIPALLAFVLLLSAWPCQAAPALSMSDEKKVLAVVQAQLKAFAADNAKQAFALATPALQTQFGTPDNFMAMVRTTYPVVYDPANVAFLKPEAQDSGVILRVQMNDQQGRPWLAVYSLQLQKDKSWRISGCVIVESRGRFV